MVMKQSTKDILHSDRRSFIIGIRKGVIFIISCITIKVPLASHNVLHAKMYTSNFNQAMPLPPFILGHL